MTNEINKVPNGLLALLDLKQLGKNPGQLSDVVIPTIDVLGAYGAYDLRLYADQTTSAVPFVATVTIPVGETWIPLHMSMAYPVGNIGGMAHMRMYVEDIPLDGIGNGAVPTLQLADNDVAWYTYRGAGVNTNIGDQPNICYSWPQRVVIPSGAKFGWQVVEDTNSAAVIYSRSLIYYKLEV